MHIPIYECVSECNCSPYVCNSVYISVFFYLPGGLGCDFGNFFSATTILALAALED